eukprot:365853-Chlamydomonas_euryale.AAC.4
MCCSSAPDPSDAETSSPRSPCTLSLSLADSRAHPAAASRNAPRSTQTEPLIRDVNVALTAVLRSELSVFLLVQWLFSTYAVAAIVTVVRWRSSCGGSGGAGIKGTEAGRAARSCGENGAKWSAHGNFGVYARNATEERQLPHGLEGEAMW